jgi:hypothetical protein
MGGPERIKLKIESYGHQEYNNNNIKDSVEYRLSNNKDVLGRDFSFIIDEESLPEYLKNNKQKYNYLFK